MYIPSGSTSGEEIGRRCADEHGEFCFVPEGENKVATLVARDDARHYQKRS
jgi:hypothetical protein